MDPDVIEIPPPIHQPSKLIKQKEVVLHDVIEIDDDEDSADLVLIGENVGKSNKGKRIKTVNDVYDDHQAMEVSDSIFCPPGVENFGPASGLESSNGFASVSQNIISVDGRGSDLSYDDDDYIDLFSEDYMDVDEYALLQAHFDNVDIPAGIEAPIPWLPDFNKALKNTGSSSLYPWGQTQSDAKNSVGTDLSQPSWSSEHAHPENQGTSVGSSSLQSNVNAFDHPSGIELSSPKFFTHTTPGKKKSASLQRGGGALNLSLGVESFKSHWSLGPFQSKKKLSAFGTSTDHGSVDNSGAMKLPAGSEPPYRGQFKGAKKVAGKNSLYHTNFVGPVDESYNPPGIESVNPWWKDSHNYNPSFTSDTAYSNFNYPFDPFYDPPEQVIGNTWVQNSAGDGKNGTAGEISAVTISDEKRDEILRKFRQFKQFDTVEDASDHHYIGNNTSMKQHSKNWAKRIQEEWKILEKDLPDSIFVRVYESRMDLLRAVIIGAEGTPYHDGLFFFDVFFPSGYPNVAPQVYYHSGGLRLNPNLYNCGKVCLSLLNTWSGSKNEKWIPGVSTILQVLVSIQGLILNTKPYFNEPGYAHMSGSQTGEMRSLQYNESTFMLSLKTMMYMIRRPPKHFEDFVIGHFCSRAHDILVACKAYINGAQVGCLAKGGVQDVDEGDGSCSKQFKESLAGYVNKLVREFTQIGARDCDKFLSPATIVSKPSLGGMPVAAT